MNAIDSIEDKIEIDANCQRNISINIFLDETVVIIIKDSGRGIDPSLMENIFDPFFTTKDIGKGTGIGLSIVSSVINLHKGTISVSSDPGKETKFIIKI